MSDHLSPLSDRLEDRAQLLWVTRVRFRALRRMLGSLFWRYWLQRNTALLHEVAERQAEVDAALEPALQRMAAEAWPQSDSTARCIREVESLRAELRRLASRRLGRAGSHESLAELWRALASLFSAPRAVAPGQRWSLALEILPASLPELRRVSVAADALELLFTRPFDAVGRLPFTPQEVARLWDVLKAAEVDLLTLWKRTHQCDPTGGLLRLLRRRSRRAPIRAPRNGPEALLRAAFWQDVARARLREVMERRFAPATVTEAELPAVMDWLLRREQEPTAPLASGEVLTDARAALLQLAHELWRGQHEGAETFRVGQRQRPSGWPPRFWESLLELARRVDAAPGTADAEQVREALRHFIGIRERVMRAPTPATLEALVTRAQHAAASAPAAGWSEPARSLWPDVASAR